jgi:hypothetical protein
LAELIARPIFFCASHYGLELQSGVANNFAGVAVCDPEFTPAELFR